MMSEVLGIKTFAFNVHFKDFYLILERKRQPLHLLLYISMYPNIELVEES